MKYFKWPAAAIMFLFLFFALQRLLVPKYAHSLIEGGMISEYYREVKEHDVIILGDCEVYDNISPVALWEEFGITSYVRGSAQQLIWHSYYLLEETLRYEKPGVVVYSVLAMMYDKPQREGYNRLTIDAMKFSDIKMKAAAASRVEGEDLISYALPLLRFNDRWSELSSEDFEYIFKRPSVTFNGYMLRSDVLPVDIGDIPAGERIADYRLGEGVYRYLDMIAGVCRENGIDLLLIKAPILRPWWHDEWDAQLEEYAHRNNLRYINFIERIEEIGIDFNEDTFNGGLNLNVYGAEKFSSYLGKILQAEFGVSDRRGEPVTAARWNEKVSEYERMKAVQLNEIEEYGAIRTFLVR